MKRSLHNALRTVEIPWSQHLPIRGQPTLVSASFIPHASLEMFNLLTDLFYLLWGMRPVMMRKFPGTSAVNKMVDDAESPGTET